MKAYFSYLLSLLLTLCGCSSEIAEEADKIIEKPVPILITTPKQIDVNTKAVVKAFTTDNISNIRIYGTNGTDHLYPDGLSPLSSDLQLQFSSKLVYPADGSNITLFGFYPLEVQNKTRPTATDQIALSLTGKEDLMYASASAGNKKEPIPVTLTFNHKLTQIKFKLKNQTNNLQELGNVSIVAIGPNTGTMDLTNGDLSVASDTTGIFTLPTNLTFNQLTTNTEREVVGELLLFPKSKYSFSLLIGNNYYPVTFDQQALTTSWNESSVYTLTISINSLSKPTTTPVVKENI